MLGKLSIHDRLEIIESLSRIVYFARSEDVYSMASCFSSLVESLYNDMSFIPSVSSDQEPEV